MSFNVLTLEQRKEWDNIVMSFKEYDTYWLSGYAKAFKLHGDGNPLLLYYDNNKTRGINVVMKRDIAKDPSFDGKIREGEYYDLSTPYGYGGWLFEGDDIADALNSYEEWARTTGIVSEFVRFHPIIRNHEQVIGFYDVVRLGEVVHMDISSSEILWANLTSKNRNMIRKAQKNGVKILHGRNAELFEEFRVIYNKTMDEDAAGKYYYFKPEFYDSIVKDLPENSQVFYAEKNGEIISAAIFLIANGFMNYHLSGRRREYNNLAPSNLLLYEAGLWGCVSGYKTLYLGGGLGSARDNLFKFKKSFNRGEVRRFYIGKKIFDKNKYDMLVNIRGCDSDSNFFPKYRA